MLNTTVCIDINRYFHGRVHKNFVLLVIFHLKQCTFLWKTTLIWAEYANKIHNHHQKTAKLCKSVKYYSVHCYQSLLSWSDSQKIRIVHICVTWRNECFKGEYVNKIYKYHPMIGNLWKSVKYHRVHWYQSLFSWSDS